MEIREATEADLPRLARLFAEMESHYGSPAGGQVEMVETRLKAWFADNTDTTLLVAEENGELNGVTSLVPLFPAGQLREALFVKDVFVSERARGQGLGEALLRAAAAIAKKRGSYRLELTVDRTNTGAARLYQRLGAQDTSKMYLRWDEKMLTDLAEGQDHA
ncbi:GNAT family N-acetyltransferase [uncultured Roseibium sp.]|uniref:GNAT family N-acetyltransferase n=1 Tax=uncultured Roseibium sp. TaxID=1936171 RepID=UPI003217AFE1